MRVNTQRVEEDSLGLIWEEVGVGEDNRRDITQAQGVIHYTEGGWQEDIGLHNTWLHWDQGKDL